MPTWIRAPLRGAYRRGGGRRGAGRATRGRSPAQLDEPHQERAQAAPGVHTEVGELSEILEDVVAQVLGLVDDQAGELPLRDESCDLVAPGAVGGGPGAFLGHSERPAIELHMSSTSPVVSDA